MAQRRIMIKVIKKIITMKSQGYSDDSVSRACEVAKETVNNITKKFVASGISWPLDETISEQKFTEIFYPSKVKAPNDTLPDWDVIKKELCHKGVTLQLLWEEYIQNTPGGLGRTAFYSQFKMWSKVLNPSMVINHKAGEKLFVDYSGVTSSYYNSELRKKQKVEIFVSAWGCSGYAFVDVTASQKNEDWVHSHVRSFNYFGCIPEVLVPDCLKSAVTKANWYSPKLNPLYSQMADHYNVVVIPARPGKPKDKAKVENCVLQVQRSVKAFGGF